MAAKKGPRSKGNAKQLKPGSEIVVPKNLEVKAFTPKLNSSVHSTNGIPVTEVAVTIPAATVEHGHPTRRVDVSRLSRLQSVALRKVVNGLVANEAKLSSGKIVESPSDSIKWLLEQVGKSTT